MKSTLICVYFAFFVGNCLAALYTFNNSAGGSWNTAVNWSPEGIPGSADDVLFPYIDGMSSQVDLTLDGDISVSSWTVEYSAYLFKSGSLTVANDCVLNGGFLYKINITLNGASKFESGGSGGAGITCDGCVVNVKKSLVFSTLSGTPGNSRLANSAVVINYAGATTTINYGSLQNGDQVATLINYGTLVFNATLATYPHTPYGDPPIAETGPWKELKNYGEIQLKVTGSPVGVPLYNDIRSFDFADGKIALRMVQESTANDRGVFDTNYEYNDGISSGGSHDYYECNIGGDVHIVFAKADVLPGEAERPFNPKVGDFFPVFINFHTCTGKIRTLTFEGLGSGLTLGRRNIVDPTTSRYHYGVVICSSSDSACINSSGEVLSPGSGPSAISSASLIEFGCVMLVALAYLLC